jgi:sporulation protein YlmC with PRC-barrel domain
MINIHDFASAGLIRPGMEVITADGRRAGYVAEVEADEIITRAPERRIPFDWIRRIDDDVHIARRFRQLS